MIERSKTFLYSYEAQLFPSQYFSRGLVNTPCGFVPIYFIFCYQCCTSVGLNTWTASTTIRSRYCWSSSSSLLLSSSPSSPLCEVSRSLVFQLLHLVCKFHYPTLQWNHLVKRYRPETNRRPRSPTDLNWWHRPLPAIFWDTRTSPF